MPNAVLAKSVEIVVKFHVSGNSCRQHTTVVCSTGDNEKRFAQDEIIFHPGQNDRLRVRGQQTVKRLIFCTQVGVVDSIIRHVVLSL